MKQVILVELNEVNFDYVEAYVSQGRLPALKGLIARHGVSQTKSEREYHEWEPWIQWVTAHSGKTLAEHKIFRLGDAVEAEIDQIWEVLERRGVHVGALSPMNAKNQLENPAFFVPDPWTKTPVTAPEGVRRVYSAIVSLIDENASGKMNKKALLHLVEGLARFSRPNNYINYVTAAYRSISNKWSRSVFLDIFLGDLFIKLLRKHKPQFSSIFLNAAAHIQHHYMFSSQVYRGGRRNPDWYVSSGQDPILEVYEAYDRFLADLMRSFPDARLLIATGLHQVPHEEETFYWRLRHHKTFLEGMGLQFSEVVPRMSRDFLVVCHSAEEALQNEALLAAAAGGDGAPLFSVDNRGTDLFVELIYPSDIDPNMEWRVGDRSLGKLRSEVAFVAIKNGCHEGTGYFLDTHTTGARAPFPLTELPAIIEIACGVSESEAA